MSNNTQLPWLPPILKESSPLYGLPVTLPIEQVAWFEAFRFAVEGADLSFRRVIATLDSLTQSTSDTPSYEAITSVLVDAWAFIDAVYRVDDELLSNTPTGMVTRTLPPEHGEAANHTAFRKLLGPIKPMRNLLHHPKPLATKAAQGGHPSLGTLSWIACEGQDGPWHRCLLIPGPPRRESTIGASHPFTDNLAPIDGVTLYWTEHSIDLSSVHVGLRTLVGQLESQLGPQVHGKPWLHAGFVVRQRVELGLLGAVRPDAPRVKP